ncbi:MAG TPA: hypothetical protein VL334_22550 [Anaerolineae bacterium]|nr:hypothetical protein [Anaerolineae bacterium]
MRKSVLIVAMVAGLLLAGCGSFWEDQGAASRTSAEARLRQAEAARQEAAAAVIDAEGRGALAESQAHALRTTIDANADLTRQAVAMADSSEYVWLFAGLAFAVLGFAGWTIWTMARRPAAAPALPPDVPQIGRGVTIETTAGQLRLVQKPEETRYHFMVRVRSLAEAISEAEREGRLLGPPR